MIKNNNDLYFCISIPATTSYKKLEPNSIIPSPRKRMEFLTKIYKENIKTFLTIKPLCPSNFIPIEEAIEIIEECYKYSTVILSSGIVIDETIINRMNIDVDDFCGKNGKLMECLENDINVKYVDVSTEIECIKEKCNELNVPFFEHSLPAIEYLKNNV